MTRLALKYVMSNTYVARSLAKIDRVAEKYPKTVASTSLLVKYVLADSGIQAFTSQESEFDWKRCISFGCFGFFYGGVNYRAFSLFQKIPWKTKPARILGSTALDLLVHMPFVYFPSYYIFRALFVDGSEKNSAATSGVMTWSLDRLHDAKSNWCNNFPSDVTMTLAVFCPIDVILFGFLPLHYRTPFLASVGIVWPVCISFFRGEKRLVASG